MVRQKNRRVRYQVAMSLDGFIADAHGGADWIVMDSDIDFAAHFAQFDTFLMGRRTFEGMPSGAEPGIKVFVFSRTLRQQDHPEVTIVSQNSGAVVERLKQESGKDIWLFGGGELFRSLLEEGVVDTVEVAVMPVLLGDGVPLFPGPELQRRLKLTSHKLFPKSGILMLEYDLQKAKEHRPKSVLSQATR